MNLNIARVLLFALYVVPLALSGRSGAGLVNASNATTTPAHPFPKTVAVKVFLLAGQSNMQGQGMVSAKGFSKISVRQVRVESSARITWRCSQRSRG